MSAISVERLVKFFRTGFWMKQSEVLKEVSFSVPKGGITGFVGTNGSGKTTSLKCILRLLKSDSGVIRVLGESEFSPEVRAQVGFLPEQPYFQPFLKAHEFLSMHLTLAGRPNNEKRIAEVLDWVGLKNVKEKRLSSFSKGMLQRIGLAQAIVHKPHLVILDEPLSGLDPEGRHLFKSILKEIAKDGVTLFFSSHLLFDVQELSDNIVIIDLGRTIYQGSIDGLITTSNRFHVDYREQGRPQSSQVSNEELQSFIDGVRSRKGEILSIQKEIQSLEAAVHSLREGIHEKSS